MKFHSVNLTCLQVKSKMNKLSQFTIKVYFKISTGRVASLLKYSEYEKLFIIYVLMQLQK